MSPSNKADTGSTFRDRVCAAIASAQDALCAAVEALDGSAMREDRWDRASGGGGVTRVLQQGTVFEKAGVNRSTVWGSLPRSAAQAMGGGARVTERYPDEIPFFATGVSTVLHPRHPLAPTAHANYRYFELGDDGESSRLWWFGGGADLTPAYLFDDDARHFHATHKTICDRFDLAFYPRFKRWCDEYFYNAHRGEGRGVGGIFFDDLHDRDRSELLRFCEACAAGFTDAYVPIIERRATGPFTPAQRRWQQLRRARYVEFNLVYDRGTAFGLRSAGRIESILMSLPLTARWEYDAQPEPDSEEARLVDVLRQPRDWA